MTRPPGARGLEVGLKVVVIGSTGIGVQVGGLCGVALPPMKRGSTVAVSAKSRASVMAITASTVLAMRASLLTAGRR